MDVHPVEMLQDQAQCILSDYIRSRHPRQPTRFGRLLLLLPGLKTVRASTVEGLFFKDTVGDTPIHKLVLDMYTMTPASRVTTAAACRFPHRAACRSRTVGVTVFPAPAARRHI